MENSENHVEPVQKDENINTNVEQSASADGQHASAAGSMHPSKFSRLFSQKKHLVAFVVIIAVAGVGTYLLASSSASPAVHTAPVLNTNAEAEIIPGEVLVKYKTEVNQDIPDQVSVDNPGRESIRQLNKSIQAEKFERVLARQKDIPKDQPAAAWYRVKQAAAPNTPKTIKRSSSQAEFDKVQALVDRYKQDPNVADAQPNYVVHANAVPNDPDYSQFWNLKLINAEAAWNYSTGGNVVVASVDSGVDRNHPDLNPNMWINSGEIPGNGVDDDHNGYIDDYTGWDFQNNDNDPMDDYGHGTYTTGIMGAAGNNARYSTGVSWQMKIMPLKALDNNGSGSMDNVAKALIYAADKGAKISNISLSCNCVNTISRDAVQYEHDRGMVSVAAAGNSNKDIIDDSPNGADSAIVVGATDQSDQRWASSGFGSKLDFVAPGVSIKSIIPDVTPWCGFTSGGYTHYCIGTGTSASAPEVAGLATLMLARVPSLTNEDIRQIIRVTAKDLGTAGKDQYYGFGRIDAGAAMTYAISGQRPLRPYFTNLHSRDVIQPGQVNESVMGWSPGPNFSSCKLEIGKGRAPTSWTLALGGCRQFATDPNGILGVIDSKTFDGGLYTVRLSATNQQGKTFEYSVYDVKIGKTIVGQAPTGSITAPGPGATVSGAVTVTANLSDDKGVTKSELYVDGIRLIGTDTTAPYSFSWDTTKETNGNHSLVVRAYDADGNTTDISSAATVSNTNPPVADTQPPTATISSPANGSVVKGTITITVNATDNVGVSKVELYFGSTLVGTKTAAPFTFTVNTALFPNGYYAPTVIAYDGGNNTGNNKSTPTVLIVNN